MSQKKDNKRKKLSSTQKILIVGIVVIVLAIIGVGAFVVSRLNSQEEPGNGPAFGSGTVVMDEKNGADLAERIRRQDMEGRYEVKMTVDWAFPDGKTASADAYIANAEANLHPVYCEVILDDGTLVYTSPLIPVGSAVDEIRLDEPLAAGYYEGVCTYHLLESEDDLTEISSVSVAVRITVKA